jgi:1-acyl-sn-glycerol-3-phosphate acyltransferase
MRATVRALGFASLTVALTVLFLLLSGLGEQVRFVCRRWWCRGTCRLLNIKVVAHGQAWRDCPTIVVPNHVSYLDVVVLGSVLDATFTAKSEVDGWPFFGTIARISGTMFLKRHWREAKRQRDAIAARMLGGESFVLFAEGTSSNGLRVGRFKTSLLSCAEPGIVDRPVAAQGATLTYLRLADGTPITAENCDQYSWHSDMDFAPHLWDVLKRDGIEVVIDLHAAIPSHAVVSRKLLGPQLQTCVAERLRDRRQGPFERPPLMQRPRAGAADELAEPLAQ